MPSQTRTRRQKRPLQESDRNSTELTTEKRQRRTQRVRTPPREKRATRSGRPTHQSPPKSNREDVTTDGNTRRNLDTSFQCVKETSCADEDLEVLPISRETPQLLKRSMESLRQHYGMSDGDDEDDDDGESREHDDTERAADGAPPIRAIPGAPFPQQSLSPSPPVGVLRPLSPRLSLRNEDLEPFDETRTLLSNCYNDIEALLQKELNVLRSELSLRLQLVEKSLERSAGQLAELFVLASGEQNSSSSPKSTALRRFEEKLTAATPHAKWVFNTETFCRVLQLNVPCAVVSIVSGGGSLADNASKALRTILFGLQPAQTRSVFATGTGKRHSEFRFSVVRNALFNVQHNRFGRFFPVGEDESEIGNTTPLASRSGCSSPSTGIATPSPTPTPVSDVSRIAQPAWLKPSVVGIRDVKEAREKLESHAKRLSRDDDDGENDPLKQSKGWIRVKYVPNERDIARFGALKVYRLVTSALYNARDKGRQCLFEELAYVLCKWSDLKVREDQRRLRMKWIHTCEGVEDLEFTDVPQCRTRSVHPLTADDHNTDLLCQFLSGREEMILCVSHDVSVRPGGSSNRKRKGVVRRTLTRAINIIDVAAKFCFMYCQQTLVEYNPAMFLGAHSDALRCVYAVAVILRRVVDKFMEECIVDGAFLATEESRLDNLECHGMKLRTLCPAESVQKRLLARRCLSMTQEDFIRHDVSGDTRAIEELGGNEDEDENNELFPSTAEGIMLV